MNKVIKVFNYQFYVKELLVIFFTFLLMENICSWLVLPNSVILNIYEKVFSIGLFGYVLYKFENLETVEKLYIGAFTAFMLVLVFKSLFYYSKFFEQFTMFTILFPVVFTIYCKCICRSLKLDPLEFLAKFYLVLYIIFMVIYGRGFSFSLDSVDMDDYGPFSGDSRIIHARSILMMIIPLLWFLNQFMKEHSIKSLLPFLFCFVVILIHQHRSVWASSIIAVLFYFFGSYRNGLIPGQKFFRTAIVGTLILVVVWVGLLRIAPSFTTLLNERFSEILDPTREGGTGKFREDQRETYYKLFWERPILGWTFEGFEMKNPLVDWWPEKSGQHFHEGYVEMLFYEGIIGFLLKYSIAFYIVLKALSKKLSQESVILIAFCAAGLVFSFSYVLPLIYWGIAGICLYYLEKKPSENLHGQNDSNDSLPEPIQVDTVIYKRKPVLQL